MQTLFECGLPNWKTLKKGLKQENEDSADMQKHLIMAVRAGVVETYRLMSYCCGRNVRSNCEEDSQMFTPITYSKFWF